MTLDPLRLTAWQRDRRVQRAAATLGKGDQRSTNSSQVCVSLYVSL